MKNLENNNLINEFLGLKGIEGITINPPVISNGHPVYLSYNNSWDWLMPVVQKINDIAKDSTIIQETVLGSATYMYWAHGDVYVCGSPSDILNEVVKFIKWYNENKEVVVKEDLRGIVDSEIDSLFETAHEHAKTTSGDITPTQMVKLDNIKEELTDLIYEQVKQNLGG